MNCFNVCMIYDKNNYIEKKYVYNVSVTSTVIAVSSRISTYNSFNIIGSNVVECHHNLLFANLYHFIANDQRIYDQNT